MLEAFALLASLVLQSNSCLNVEVQVGTCIIDATIGDGEATLDGSVSTPGESETPGYTGGESAPIGCETLSDGSCVRDTFTVTAPVTLADIANFRPTPATDSMEPRGWAVVGLPANFFGSSGSQVHDGTLFGAAASVRFTPVSWSWDYGDDTSAARGTSGASWASLGIREFDATPTSHTFRRPGDYTISLTIRYTAEYRVASSGWIAIAGTLPMKANDLTVSATSAQTVLVKDACLHDQRQRGC